MTVKFVKFVAALFLTISTSLCTAATNDESLALFARGTGHREAVQIFYDPSKVTYEMLLEVFWRSVDPTDGGGQFCDRGVSYETAVFVTSLDQRRSAEASKKALMNSGALKKPIVTKIEDAGKFYPAEDYHQDYYKKTGALQILPLQLWPRPTRGGVVGRPGL